VPSTRFDTAVLEHGRPSPATCSLTKIPASLSQKPSLAVEKRMVAKILAIVLDQVEIEDRGTAASRRRSSSKRDKPSGPSTTASPSIMKLFALIRCAIAGRLAARSFALRVQSRIRAQTAVLKL
jgi:hypothetical protein